MTKVTLYENPVLLDRNQHRELKIKVASDFEFSTKATSVYLAGVEFNEACREYPIVFGKSDSGIVSPVVVLGLRNDENLFIDELRQWAAGYIPAFVRRYPFVLAEMEDQSMGVCIDLACPGIQNDEGERIFELDGGETEYLKNALAFLRQYQFDHKVTQTFCEWLFDKDLLMEMSAQAKLDDGSVSSVNSFYVVDQQKLKALPESGVMEAWNKGYLNWIYSHLISVKNINLLVGKLAHLKKRNATLDA